MSKLMKGKTFKDGKKKLTYPAIVEIKLDEIRCDVRLDADLRARFLSYAEKPLANLGFQFEATFGRFMGDIEHDRLDCGVLVNRSFNDTYRWVRSTKGVPVDLLGAKIEFILFDLPANTMPFSQRVGFLDAIAKVGRERYGLPFIRPMRATVYEEEGVWSMFGKAREEGYEGLMVKTLDHKYEVGKRTAGWLKVKPEDDADGVITAINRAYSLEGAPLDRAGSVSIKCEDGSTADAGGMDHELGRLMLAAPSMFIGKWATFTYMERDRQGGYRHPRFQRLREDKA
ncbi:ATP-dependent DNA ligase [Ralstonia phage RSB3]|uniref:DNA ligase n=1 Tax=Ralstonia phage RSB3 TaxID=1402875 RepID=U3TIX8_9CAUD|nr:ATP-dependent DNA ligase [Ralstonia phage RSB3]BAN92331.1 putative DNA ligase [Ralstonia phage RSB3]